MTKHTYVTTLQIDVGDTGTAHEVEIELDFTVTWGAPEQGPSYASGGEPADPDEIDLQDVYVLVPLGVKVTTGTMTEGHVVYGREKAPSWLRAIVDEAVFGDDDHHHKRMLESAAEDGGEF